MSGVGASDETYGIGCIFIAFLCTVAWVFWTNGPVSRAVLVAAAGCFLANAWLETARAVREAATGAGFWPRVSEAAAQNDRTLKGAPCSPFV